MKKVTGSLILIITFLTFISCEENLNPFGELKEKYVLNCVIRADTTFQTATLTKSYSIENFDPYSSTNDPTVKNAVIRIWNKDKVAILRDTTVPRPEGDKYKTPYTIFYTKNFQPDPESSIEIEALLPNGKRLTSSATIPAALSFSYSQSDATIPPKSEDYVTIKWNTDQRNAVFITHLAIYYFKHEGGEKKRYIAVIPINYVKFGNQYIPNYPKPTGDLAYAVDMSTISKAMELISADDPNKERYEILSCIMDVLSLDENLSTYYNSTARGRDIYSVKLDETDFSNIKGGFGLFGVYIKSYYVIRFSHAYIRSFGYIPGLSE